MRSPGCLALLLASCAVPAPPAWNGSSPGQATNLCLEQDGIAVMTRIKALGTEPFWSAEVEGRCVTYKTPENQQGTRIWTRFGPVAGGQVWEGALGGRQFQLAVKAVAECSDGMSDRHYPLAAELRVNGEIRRGCAEELAAP